MSSLVSSACKKCCLLCTHSIWLCVKVSFALSRARKEMGSRDGKCCIISLSWIWGKDCKMVSSSASIVLVGLLELPSSELFGESHVCTVASIWAWEMYVWKVCSLWYFDRTAVKLGMICCQMRYWICWLLLFLLVLCFGVHCHLGDWGFTVCEFGDQDQDVFGRWKVGRDKSCCRFSGDREVCVCVIMFRLWSSIRGESEMLEGQDMVQQMLVSSRGIGMALSNFVFFGGIGLV